MGSRILVTTPALTGHVQPMAPLAQALAARGHDVRWATPADGVAEVERCGLRAVAATPAFPSGPRAALERFPWLASLPPDEMPEVMFGKLFGAIAAPKMLAGLIPLVSDWRPDLVLSDAAELAGPIVAAEVGVACVTKGFGPLLPAARVARAADEVAPLWRSRGLEPRPFCGCYETMYLDPFPPLLRWGAAPHVRRRQSIHPAADVGNLDPSVAPPLPAGDTDSLIVYVTMGTVFGDPRPLRAVVGAVVERGLRALVTVGPAGDLAALGELPGRVRVERYVPQSHVFPHCSVVVCHGGSGTTLGALGAGVPLLCLPQGADNFLNAAAAENAGAAIALRPGEVATDAVATALDRLIREPRFRESARRVSEDIASMPSAADVAADLESFVAR